MCTFMLTWWLMAMFQSTAVSNGPAGEPCQTRSAAPSQTAEDFCSICYVDTLGAQPVIRLACGHIVHAACAKVCHPWVFEMTLIMFCVKGSVFRTINTVVQGLFRTGVFVLDFVGLCSDMAYKYTSLLYFGVKRMSSYSTTITWVLLRRRSWITSGQVFGLRLGFLAAHCVLMSCAIPVLTRV